MADSTTAAANSGGFWGGLQNLLGTAATVYTTATGQKLTEQTAAANAAAAQARAQADAAKAVNSVPWYKQPWVIPAALGLGALLVIGIVFKRRD